MNAAVHDTRYFEKYAKLSLACCYDPSWDLLTCGEGVESPDLQSDALDVGVEVTRAISSEEGAAQKVLQEYFQSETAQDWKWSRAYPDLRGETELLEAVVAVSAFNGKYSFKIHLQNLNRAIETKTKKLNKNYKHFKTNGLYIFTFTTDWSREKVQRAVRAASSTAEYDIQYDILFINCIDKIYAVDMQREEVIRIDVPEDTLTRLRDEAFTF